MEQTTATDRLNKAILSLRRDLIEMRCHDVKLMKQLLNINLTIQKMTNERLSQTLHPRKLSYLRNAIFRQQSAPAGPIFQRDDLDSSSSTEDFSGDMSDFSDIDDDIFSKTMVTHFRSSIHSIQPLNEHEGDDCSDEEVLRTNIKLWKHSQGCDSD